MHAFTFPSDFLARAYLRWEVESVLFFLILAASLEGKLRKRVARLDDFPVRRSSPLNDWFKSRVNVLSRHRGNNVLNFEGT